MARRGRESLAGVGQVKAGKEKPQGRGGSAEVSSENGMQADGSAVLAPKSTATEQQRARILEALR